MNTRNFVLRAALATSLVTTSLAARADAITDWNQKSGELVIESKMGTPPAVRAMAIVQTSAFEAANAVTQRYGSSRLQLERAPGASVDAAIAAAHRATLTKLFPAQQSAIDTAYQSALAAIADGAAKTDGIAVGEKAAAAVLAARANDGAGAAETYRPHTIAGVYVPTVVPAVPQWVQRKPWVMTSPAQFRPAPPPTLASEAWVRDYNEVKQIGGKNSTRRSAEQTDIARFWDFSLPSIYHGVVRSVALAPGREATQNARLFAVVAQAMDDAMIAVFDAKYHYHFWRPITAIRNADIDGNDSTEREASWASFIDTPMHPEYPAGHGILAGAINGALQAEVGSGTMPTLTTTSPSAKGATRRWNSLEDFSQEVANARVYGGMHYRNSAETGVAMGKQIGALAAKSL